jgi:hypothetical protein
MYKVIPHKPIPIELGGKTRHLLYDNNALVAIENELGFRIQDLFPWLINRGLSGLRDNLIILWAGLIHEDPALTPRTVIDMVETLEDFIMTGAKIGEAFKEFGNANHKPYEKPGGDDSPGWFVVPANISGRWTWTMGGIKVEMKVGQSFQFAQAVVTIDGNEAGIKRVLITGDEVWFVTDGKIYGGKAWGNTITGTVRFQTDGKEIIWEWKAKRDPGTKGLTFKDIGGAGDIEKAWAVIKISLRNPPIEEQAQRCVQRMMMGIRG